MNDLTAKRKFLDLVSFEEKRGENIGDFYHFISPNGRKLI